MIRAYKASDLEGVLKVWYEVAQVAYDFLPVTEIQSIRDDIKERYMPMADTWVSIEDDEVVGFITLVDTIVGGLFVAPCYQNIGIGKALIEHAKKRKKTISLSVLKESTRALKFYERCGFVPTREALCPLTNMAMVTVNLS